MLPNLTAPFLTSVPVYLTLKLNSLTSTPAGFISNIQQTRINIELGVNMPYFESKH